MLQAFDYIGIVSNNEICISGCRVILSFAFS